MATIVHPECGKTWTGLRKEHCPACHETFSSTQAGDRHRRGQHGIDRHCLNPADASLVQADDGVWHRPGSYTR